MVVLGRGPAESPQGLQSLASVGAPPIDIPAGATLVPITGAAAVVPFPWMAQPLPAYSSQTFWPLLHYRLSPYSVLRGRRGHPHLSYHCTEARISQPHFTDEKTKCSGR